MNTQSPFVDFYQILDIDLSADPKEIEKQFFEMGQKLHPNVPVTGDKDKFEMLTQAFQTLRVPESRQAYDEIYLEQESGASIQEPLGGDSTGDQDNLDANMENMDLEKEAQDRILLMKKFYERRRMNPQNSGLASGALEGVIQCSSTMLDFHIWYCHLKGWLYREESGQLSITAEGVDHVENGLR